MSTSDNHASKYICITKMFAINIVQSMRVPMRARPMLAFFGIFYLSSEFGPHSYTTIGMKIKMHLSEKEKLRATRWKTNFIKYPAILT